MTIVVIGANQVNCPESIALYQMAAVTGLFTASVIHVSVDSPFPQ
jgi:hypothetical protein